MNDMIDVRGTSVNLSIVESNGSITDYDQEIASIVHEIRDELIKTAAQIVRVGYSINRLKELTGKSFNAICEKEFPQLSTRTLGRYIAAYRFVNTERIKNLNNIDTSALYLMMMSTTSEGVLELCKQKIENDEPLHAKDIRKMIKEESSDTLDEYQTKLQEMQFELTNTKEQLKEANKKAMSEQSNALRLQASLDRLIKNENSATYEIEQLTNKLMVQQEELSNFKNVLIEKNKNPSVVIKEVEILPSGYSSIEEAIKEKETQLKLTQEQLTQYQDSLTNIKNELSEIELKKQEADQAIEAQSKIRDSFLNFMNTIDTLSEQQSTLLKELVSELTKAETKAFKNSVKLLTIITKNIESVIVKN